MSVYFARSGAYVKIGYSHDPFERVATITRNGTRPTDVPYLADAMLLGWIPGDHARESAIHRQFAASHVAGEWFYLDDETVRDLIWSDPRGIDVRNMSALAVFAAHAYPELTREEMAVAGIGIQAAGPGAIDRILGGAA